jgi:hypothetical protein
MLPLELALRLLPGRELALEGSLGLIEGGLLLLEMSLRLLMYTFLLAELLPHCSKRRDLVRQVSPSLSASLAFSSTWACQDRAPLRVARSCWS